MKPHRRKMAAPIIVSVILVLYYAAYFGFLLTLLDGLWKYVWGLVPLVFSAITIQVCVDRIKEIRGGEEDDIGKY